MDSDIIVRLLSLLFLFGAAAFSYRQTEKDGDYRGTRTIIFFVLIAVPLFFDALLSISEAYNGIKNILLFLAVIPSAIILFFRSDSGFPMVKSPLNLPVILFLAVNIIMIPAALNKPDAINAVLILSVRVILFFMASALISQRKDRTALYKFIGTAGFLVGLYGIFQSFMIDFVPLSDNYDPVSTLGHRNVAAQFLIICIPFITAWVIETRDLKSGIFPVMCLIVASLHLLLTKCRGAWLGMLGAAGLLLFIILFLKLKKKRVRPENKKPGKRVIPVVISVILIIMLSIPLGYSFWGRFLSSFDPGKGTARFRILAWDATLKIIKDHPLGVGPANFRQHYPLYRASDESLFSGEHTFVHKTHNDHLQIWCELGIAGLFLWIFLLTTAARTVIQILKRLQNKAELKYFTLACITSVVATLIHSFFSFNLSFSAASSAYFWIILGLIGSVHRRMDKAPPPVIRLKIKIPSPFREIIPAVLIALTAYFLVFKPVAASYYHQRGKAAQDSGYHRAAVKEFDRAIQYDPTNYDYYLRQGVSYARIGKFAEAIHATGMVLKYFPHYRNAIFNLGSVYEQLQDWEKAAEYYRRAVELDPVNLSATNNLIVMYVKLKKFQKGIETAREALKIHPYSADIHNNLGVLYYHLGEYRKALEEFQKTVELRRKIVFESSTVNNFSVMGRIKYRFGALNSAQEWVLKPNKWGILKISPKTGIPEILEEAPGGDFKWNAEDSLLVLTFEDIPEADSFVMQYSIKGKTDHVVIAKRDPVFAKAYLNIGKCLEELNLPEETPHYYRQAQKLQPEYYKAYVSEYNVLLQMDGDRERLRFLQSKIEELKQSNTISN